MAKHRNLEDMTPLEINALSRTRQEALKIISYYYEHHPKKYLSDEKNFQYEFGLKEAYREVRLGRDTPLNILDRLVAQYDSWAHCDCSNDDAFGIMATAVDDLIDMILNS